MNTLFDVKQEVRGLLGDPDGDWVTDGYVTPIIGTTYRLQTLAIKNAAGQNLEAVQLVLNVPAGTTTLLPFQAPGKPLCGLYTVVEMWTKPAGTPPNFFREAYERRYPANVAPPGVPLVNGSPVVCWTWLGNQLIISPVNAALDIEVIGRFNPPPLIKNEDPLIVSPDMQSVTASGAAAVAGIERTNPALLEGYSQMAVAGVDNIAAELIRQKQHMPARLGRMDRNQSGFYGWYWR